MTIARAKTMQGGYLYQQQTVVKATKHIDRLITERLRKHHTGNGDLEPIKHKWLGYWSRYSDKEPWLVYEVTQSRLTIAQFH